MSITTRPETDAVYDIEQIRQQNARQGFHFFEASTMRFFRSRVLSTVHQGPGGVYFVTSEQFEDSRGSRAARRYTVRRFWPGRADITTPPVQDEKGFQRWATPRAAYAYARRLAAGEEAEAAACPV